MKDTFRIGNVLLKYESSLLSYSYTYFRLLSISRDVQKSVYQSNHRAFVPGSRSVKDIQTMGNVHLK